MVPLQLIETFVLFGETLNLSKTAALLSQTQPSASRQIDQFQTYFQQQLFEFVGRQKKLTAYGHEIHTYYKSAILHLRELQKNIDYMPFQNTFQKMILAARSEILEQYICPLAFNFPVELKALSSTEIKEALKLKRIDMAVTQDHFDSFDFIRKKLFSTKYVIALPKNWMIKVKTAQLWFEMSEAYPFLSYDSDLKLYSKFLLKGVFLPSFNLNFIANDWRIVSKKIDQGAGWSIIPEEFSKKNNISCIPTDDVFTESQFYIYIKKELSRNKSIKSIIQQLSE